MRPVEEAAPTTSDLSREIAMIVEFWDRSNKVLHRDFQEWRRLHPSGYFLTFLSKRRVRLHETLCRHPGNVEWTYEDTGESLTTSRKVCDDTEFALTAWAAENGLTVIRCSDCMKH